jgi:phosphoribosylamine-glycine ligase
LKQFLDGEEASFMVVANGSTAVHFSHLDKTTNVLLRR